MIDALTLRLDADEMVIDLRLALTCDASSRRSRAALPTDYMTPRSVATVASRKDQVKQGLWGESDTHRRVVAGQRPYRWLWTHNGRAGIRREA